MNEAFIGLTITTLGVFLVFASFLIWGLKTGQFKNVEEPKYRMLESDKYENIGLEEGKDG